MLYADSKCSLARSGYAYVEVLLSVVLLGILLVPALQALQSGVAGSSSAIATQQVGLRAKMEEVLAKPFYDLYKETYAAGGNTTSAVSTTFSDAAGSANRRVVVLYRFDTGSNGLSNNDTGLLYVQVYYESDGSANALSTLIGQWW